MERPWTAHYDPGVPASLDYPDISLPTFFDRTAERYPDRVATVFHDARIRYGALKRRIDSFASGLISAGIQPGDRVAVMLPNVFEFPIAYYAALRIGAVIVPMNGLLKEREVAFYLGDAGAKSTQRFRQ